MLAGGPLVLAVCSLRPAGLLSLQNRRNAATHAQSMLARAAIGARASSAAMGQPLQTAGGYGCEQGWREAWAPDGSQNAQACDLAGQRTPLLEHPIGQRNPSASDKRTLKTSVTGELQDQPQHVQQHVALELGLNLIFPCSICGLPRSSSHVIKGGNIFQHRQYPSRSAVEHR